MIEQSAAKGFDALFDRGVLGVACAFLILALCVLGWVIRKLDGDLKASNAALLAMTEKVAGIARDAIAANNQNAIANQAVEAALEARGRVVEDLSRQVERMSSDVRHGQGNVLNALNGLPILLANTTDKLASRIEHLGDLLKQAFKL